MEIGSSGLGEFLRARRSRADPVALGLPHDAGRRRVPGLRREELALLAGVSVSYYTRLEQGHSRGASDEVLDALARALDLGDDERAHLHRVASTSARSRSADRPEPEQLHPATRDLLAAMADVPAVVQGRSADLLAWNRLGHALLAGHLPFAATDDPARRPNAARLVFLDAHTRELWVDWERKAAAMVGNLRLATGRYPDDESLTALVGELVTRSATFARLWADHRIRACDAADYELAHPVVGTLRITQQALDIARSPDQTLVVMTARPGSPSGDALAVLAQVASAGLG